MSLLFAATSVVTRRRRRVAAVPDVEYPTGLFTLTYSGIDEDDSETDFAHQARAYGSSDAWVTYGVTAALSGVGLTFSSAIDGHPYNTDLECRTIARNSIATINAYDPIRVRTAPEFGPTALIVSSITDTGATVSFTPPSPAPITGYRGYYRAAGTVPWLLGNTVASGSTAFEFTGLTPDTNYQFSATAYNLNDGGIPDAETSRSTSVTATTTESVVVFTPGWGAPITISTVGDAVVATAGTLVEAINLGSTASPTINTVPFTGQMARDGLGVAESLVTFYQDSEVGLSAGFLTILRSLAYSITEDRQVTLTGLTPGQNYLVQLFISDDRTADGLNMRTNTFTLAEYVSGTYALGDSYALSCFFVATAATQQLFIAATGGAYHINAFQVRHLP